MKCSIKEAAEHFQKLKVWVYPASEFNETDICFHWKDWRNKNEAEYEEEAKDYHWGFSEKLMYKNIVMGNAISLVLGKKGLIAIRCKKESFFHGYTIQETLKELGLPLDYQWVFSRTFYTQNDDLYVIKHKGPFSYTYNKGNYAETFTYIIIDAANIPSGSFLKNLRRYDIITEAGLVLPVEFDLEALPKERPIQIQWNKIIVTLTQMSDRNFKSEFGFWKYVFNCIFYNVLIFLSKPAVKGILLLILVYTLYWIVKYYIIKLLDLSSTAEEILLFPFLGDVPIFLCIALLLLLWEYIKNKFKK